MKYIRILSKSIEEKENRIKELDKELKNIENSLNKKKGRRTHI